MDNRFGNQFDNDKRLFDEVVDEDDDGGYEGTFLAVDSLSSNEQTGRGLPVFSLSKHFSKSSDFKNRL